MTVAHPEPERRTVVLVSDGFGSNSMGRTFCIWQMAESLGWDVRIIAQQNEEIWTPLRGSAIESKCESLADVEANHPEQLIGADLIIAIKPLPESLGLAEKLGARYRVPVLVDIDDPDLEAQLSWSNVPKRLAKAVLRPARIRDLKRMKRLTTRFPTIVSNPVLAARYGGRIVPHVRSGLPDGGAHSSWRPRVAFVGTNRGHKGIEMLREAVTLVRDTRISLTITDERPVDAYDWETWVGRTSLSDGLALVASCDIVVIPSLSTDFSRGQLPVKLMDAMLMGRAIIASNVEPIPWALGGTGRIVAAGSPSQIARELRALCDPAVRQEMGDAARDRAKQMFQLESVTPSFLAACNNAISGHWAQAGNPTERSYTI